MNITHRIFLAVFVTVHGAAGAAESVSSKPALPHFDPKGVVFSYEGLRYRPHDDVIFPSVVATSGRFRNALGRYYLYYAPHDAPGGICLAYADHLEGPWKEHAQNPVISREWKPHYKVSHVSGPHAIWNDAEKSVFLYFHGENSDTRLATSRDGIHFDYDRTVITTADFPGLSEASYARVFEHKLPDVDNRFIMLLMGNNQGTRRIYLAWSKDGRKWTPRAEPFMDPPPGNDQVAGAWLLPWKGRNYIIAHANPNLAQGASGINGRGFDLYLNEADAAFTKAKPIGKFMEASAFGADNPALMSPCFFEENGALYLFVNIGPRLNNTIALAVAKPGAPLAALDAADSQPSAEQRDDAAWIRGNGTLIFHDAFDREETGHGLKAIGNGWESATADRVPHIKQADLDGGVLKIASATKEAGHAAHIHHDAGFTDGGAFVRFKFPGLSNDESLLLGFVDRETKGVHAGHLCYADLGPGGITLMDRKTGVMNLEIRKRRQEHLDRKEKLPADLEALLKTKQITVPWKADHAWHELALVTEGDEMRLSIDGKLVAYHRSEGFAHPMKRWFSLLVPNTVLIDDVKIWKVK